MLWTALLRQSAQFLGDLPAAHSLGSLFSVLLWTTPQVRPAKATLSRRGWRARGAGRRATSRQGRASPPGLPTFPHAGAPSLPRQESAARASCLVRGNLVSTGRPS